MAEFKKEKRKYNRYNVESIHGNMLYSADVNIVNISFDGVSIETTKRLNIDKSYSLKIKYRDRILNLSGVVVWSILSRNETKKTGEIVPIYKAGLRFTNILNDKSSELLKFIDDNRIESIEKRLLGIRFKINDPDEAQIDYQYEYNVKKISLSGMLIETEHSFDIDSRHNIEIFLDGKVISMIGRVVHSVEVTKDNAKMYDVGIEFIDFSDEDKSSLKQFLENLDIGQNDT
jgi:hypothetical protein